MCLRNILSEAKFLNRSVTEVIYVSIMYIFIGRYNWTFQQKCYSCFRYLKDNTPVYRTIVWWKQEWIAFNRCLINYFVSCTTEIWSEHRSSTRMINAYVGGSDYITFTGRLILSYHYILLQTCARYLNTSHKSPVYKFCSFLTLLIVRILETSL